MASFLRLLLGLFLLPACWGVCVAFVEVFVLCGLSSTALAFVGGLVAFSLCWLLLSRPVRTYVLGHELTHALWGLFFGAVPSRLRVGPQGGSVNLTKSNVLITLAPYFFPFYTFVVILIALLVACFVHPLPWTPLWAFLIGFTWAFHALFTFDSLCHTQPDVQLYGRLFSWTVIFLANALLVSVALAFASGYGILSFVETLAHALVDSYMGCARGFVSVFRFATST